MIITAPSEDVEIKCGGEPMSQGEDGNGGSVHQDHADGSVIGKRYTNDEGSLEVLCVKAGEGSLWASGAAMKVKDATKLPKTD
ncbi:MAG: hypothetical protein OXQ84_22380 [bacterium]|nr:hypothetical protein [bacterium]